MENVMRMYSSILAGLAGLALVAGAPFSSQAQSSKSWGPKHTTYWSTEATGMHDPGKFMAPTMLPTAQPPVTQIQYRQQTRQQRMYYQPAGKRVRAQMRVRQQQPGMRPGQPPANQGPPPAERTDQPPPNTSPGAPPSQGQQPVPK
jgi:hypothetical protein